MSWPWLIVLFPRLALYAILTLAVALVFGVIFILSGSDAYTMIVNMIGALSTLMAFIAVVEVLKRKAKTKR